MADTVSDVIEFPQRPKPQLVPGSDAGIPAELRQLALDIENGAFEGIDAMLIVLWGDGGAISFPVGRDISTIEGVGMLEMAKADMLDSNSLTIEFSPDGAS
jgi:hypothetical protein